MRCKRSEGVIAVSLVLFLVGPLAEAAASDRWKGFYGSEALDRTASQTSPDIRVILEEDVPRVLTAEERQRLAGVRIEFPLEDPSYPLNFYSQSVTKRVLMPVSSLRFLRDMLAAYAWMSSKGYDLQPITDYLCIMKYQWPGRLREVTHTPLEALGVPANALDDPATMARFQQLFGSAIVFILGHELGHIYYQHGEDEQISSETARHQEQDADAFALDMMLRMGAIPIGAPFYFHIVTHLEPFSGDSNFRVDRANRTHPLSPQRIEAIADNIKSNAKRFSVSAARPKIAKMEAVKIADKLREVAHILGDEGVQNALRRIGLSATLETLQPRRPGGLPKLSGEDAAPAGVFSGTFVGKWFDAKGTDLDVKMVLTRKGDTVEGSYTLGTVDDKGQHYTHGSSVITMAGTVREDVLEYEWHWGTDYFGRGQLRIAKGGQTLSGTWGYSKATNGDGSWQLRRSN